MDGYVRFLLFLSCTCVSQIPSGLLFSAARSHTAIWGGFFLCLYSTSKFAEQLPGNFYFTPMTALWGWHHPFPLRRGADKTREANRRGGFVENENHLLRVPDLFRLLSCTTVASWYSLNTQLTVKIPWKIDGSLLSESLLMCSEGLRHWLKEEWKAIGSSFLAGEWPQQKLEKGYLCLNGPYRQGLGWLGKAHSLISKWNLN